MLYMNKKRGMAMYKFKKYVSWQYLNQNLYIFDERKADYFVLDGMARELCIELTDTCVPNNDFLEKIAERYCIDKKQIESDYLEIMKQLYEEELVEENEYE